MSEIITFVGGPEDGATRAVSELIDMFRTPAFEPLSVRDVENLTFSVMKVHVYRQRYYQGRPSLNDCGQWVYDYQGLKEW